MTRDAFLAAYAAAVAAHRASGCLAAPVPTSLDVVVELWRDGHKARQWHVLELARLYGCRLADSD